MSENIFGIDLGTTNSCLAVMETAGPRVITIDGEPTVPSIVHLDPESGRFMVGQRARNRLLLDPEATVRSIKRRMGEQEDVPLGGQALRPEVIAAEILRYLKEEGEKALGQPVQRAVITVPAYFEDAQRRATIRAGELAGLDVVRILNEPTAAALVYDRLQRRSADQTEHSDGVGQRILVYDLGGGTFDVSVVELSGELNEVRASGGNSRLGGDDFDARLAIYLGEQLAALPTPGSVEDMRLQARLTLAAEKAKIDLSTRPYTRVMEEALVGAAHLDMEIERHTFEKLLDDLLILTMGETERVLDDAELEVEQIDQVVLVGGSTHMPRIHDLLAARFPCPVAHSVDPGLCVAMGAAVQGALLEGRLFDHILVDVAPHSLGVRTMDNLFADDFFGDDAGNPTRKADHFATIIRRNTPIPVTQSEVFYTLSDNQRRVQVAVFQGESPRCSENTAIGSFDFDLEPAPANSPIVDELSYDLEGIIHVVVHQKGTENRKEVTLSTRQRTLEETAVAGGSEVDNYIIRKARMRAANLPPGSLRDRLRSAAAYYELALDKEDTEMAVLDEAEEALLELLEEVEEAVTHGA